MVKTSWAIELTYFEHIMFLTPDPEETGLSEDLRTS